jgi:antitoxin (DNA-binding transcriptional repressor) of toxin-antitoxin stability system
MFEPGEPRQIPTSQARERLSAICAYVQDPRNFVVLTRHGKPVAAVVSMPALKATWQVQDVEGIAKKGAPLPWISDEKGMPLTPREVAVKIQRVQMDRAQERRALERQGYQVVRGGELEPELTEVVAEPAAPKRRWWWPVGGRTSAT